MSYEVTKHTHIISYPISYTLFKEKGVLLFEFDECLFRLKLKMNTIHFHPNEVAEQAIMRVLAEWHYKHNKKRN